MNLTSDQEQALLSLTQIQKGRMFIGITSSVVEKDFKDINQKLLTANTDFTKKLRDSEHALFALCGYAPSP